MKRKFGKYLALFLSISMLAGTVPAYAADGLGVSDFSVETDANETSEDGQWTSGAETISENTTESTDNSAALESSDNSEDLEEEAITENQENTGEESSSDQISQENDEALSEETESTSTKEYLNNLSVYSGNGVKDPMEITRREDLDTSYGGITYTVEVGSSYNSNGLYFAADLAENAPENSSIHLSACDLDGNTQEVELSTTSYTDGSRCNLSNIFTKNNGKRAVYTISVGNDTDSQTYKIVVIRRLDLSKISCYLPSDTDMAKNLISEFDSTGITRDYEVAVGENTESVTISAKAFDDTWYGLTINGQAVSSSDAITLPLTDEKTEIHFEMQEEGSYQDAAYQDLSYISTGTYTITVCKKKEVSLAFETDPSDAVISVYDNDGEKVEPSENATVYNSLRQGEKYTWNVSKYGYISQRQEFIAGEESTIKVTLKEQTATQTEITDNDWTSYQNSETNNGITDTLTPTSGDSAVQKWAMHLSSKGWDATLTSPLILGGALYVASGYYIYKIDKDTGEILQTSEKMKGTVHYALNPLGYGEGMLFAQLEGGQIQAFSATSLKSLWISEELGGQALSPITYKDGYIYTGTWNSDTTAGSYFCLSVTDEDPSTSDETKYCSWKYNHKGGFYWAGSYASENYLVFGSDDGAGDNYTSILYSVNTHTGQLIDKYRDVIGDIRSTIVYNDGYVYFTTKGGYLYRVVMNEDGTFGKVDSYNLGGAATSTPVVYKGRIYVGVCGSGGQYNADGGHHFDVIEESLSGLSLAYQVAIPGYPQAAPVLSTAYENQDFDGDGKADGRVYLYFTYNAYPGGIYMLTDEPGQTSGTAEELFRPAKEQQEYCLSTITVDRDGTLYYKNDSAYLMAVETNGAYLDSVTAEADDGRVKWEKAFQRSEAEHTLHVASSAKKVTLALQAPTGCTITVNGKKISGSYETDVSKGDTDLTVKVSQNGKSREYIFHLTKDVGNSSLANMMVSTSNIYSDSSKYLTVSPEFSPTKTEYKVTYLADEEGNTENFLRLYMETSSTDSTLSVEAVSGIDANKVSKLTFPTAVNGNVKKVPIYWDKDASEAKVKITVTSSGGGKTEYYLTIIRKEVFGSWKTISKATIFSPEKQRRTSNLGNTEERTVGKKLTPTIKLSASSIKLQVKQSTSKVKVSGLANGDYVKSWTSSNKKIVTVSSKGVIKGVKAGSAKVTITLASGKKKTISVKVQKSAIKTSKISGLKSSLTLEKGKKIPLSPVLTPITSQEKISYSSSNKKIVTVSSKGVIKGVKAGKAYVTVKSGKISKKIKVTVK